MLCCKYTCGIITAAAVTLVAGAALSASAQPPAGDKKPAATPAQPAGKPDAAKPAAKPDAAKPDAGKGGQPSPADMAAMMKKYEEAATPGAAHFMMAKSAGDFTATVKTREGPDQKWTETTGSAKKTMILGGRFLHEEFDGSMPMPGPDGAPKNMPFQGSGIFGYNNVTKKYEASWVDSMGTGVMHMTGHSTDGGKTVEWVGSFDDPLQGPQTMRIVAKHIDDDHGVSEFYMHGPNGKDFEMMEISYARKAAAKGAAK